MPESGSTLIVVLRGSYAAWSLIVPFGRPIGDIPATRNVFSSARRRDGFHGTGSVSAAAASALALAYSLLAGMGMPFSPGSPGSPEIAARNAMAGRVSEPIMDSWGHASGGVGPG